MVSQSTLQKNLTLKFEIKRLNAIAFNIHSIRVWTPPEAGVMTSAKCCIVNLYGFGGGFLLLYNICYLFQEGLDDFVFEYNSRSYQT